MESVALSRTTRWGMMLTGLLQGVLCYLLMAWLVPQNSDWLFYGMPATIALSSMLLLTVVSFKQGALWGWLALIFMVVLAMSGWLRWQVEAVDKWRQAELLWLYGLRLVLMAMLVLPWMQYQLHSQTGSARYPQFYMRLWHNVLTLFIALAANGLFWLVLLLWSALFKLVGIRFFSTLFFETEGFIYVAIGLITALAVILARTQSRLVAAVQKLLTLIATGLLPVVSLLALLFIVTLPFTGLAAISARVSAAGLLSTLTLMLLLLVAIVNEPQKRVLPYPRALRGMISASLCVAPIYMLLAGWALWVRIQQYGWTPDRLYGALTVFVLLIWSFGYLSGLLRRGRDPGERQGKVILSVSLLTLVILLLLASPVLDVWRISVNSHMARYHSGKITADQVSLYMLEHSGKTGQEALKSLLDDETFTQDIKRKRELTTFLQGNKASPTADDLARVVMMAPGSQKPDAAFWTFVKEQNYSAASCFEQDACVLVSQDLNGDGQPEQVLYNFIVAESQLYGLKDRKWTQIAFAPLPDGFSKTQLLHAIAGHRLGSAPKAWRDIIVDGKRLDVNYYNE
ncbi:DUF4153 domain-containing protein [Salmonella enterica subsp. houtenae]|uniref:DUF4153 domain-containing protein n=6 Tax=Salmonella enterica TaxID=28901 RepID=A0A5U3R2S6_SALER|nr:DUF4153 domain-containing protein [Salmonella enterica]EAA3679112.1 DUF4153 domain-containing protein [Salmonella enterica subsp. houtenae]EAA7383284.1 DUF4153 domain-containing protein [Salmonella enterica subsp. enterica]EBI0038413.1 DUF4153 domain-containing protein [Salmonella enterica subsp. diarizonae serovar 61:k:z35]EBR0107634.1 DUF4153 domain-containing protein [Salmonella enterica subsp. houtenae serovar Houten]ECM3644713.1 DUF4153 domain-containing protein [Salmonella enterica su